MFKEILVPVDNSEHSNHSVEVGIALAKKYNACLVGNHVYAAKLHDKRFAQMEDGLPEEYQEPKELDRQRKIHDTLITRGLEIISDSFLDYAEKKCEEENVPFKRKMLEGKNYKEIVKDIESSDYSLVVMGAIGLGGLHRTALGSVTSRVIRRSKTNVLVVRRREEWNRKIMVAIDGSKESFAAAKLGANLAKTFGVPLEGVAVFDPEFHIIAFRNIAEVLSDEAAKVFRFKEQEKLHDEIIDKGLEKIYLEHLEIAKATAAAEGVEMKTTLKAGRPVEKLLDYVDEENPSLLLLGRIGYHSDNGLDLGNVSENVLAQAKTNLLVVSERYQPPQDKKREENMEKIEWTPEAVARMERVPEFVRNMAKKAIVDYAVSKGYEKITEEVVVEARGAIGM